MDREKIPEINVGVVGHIDHGKTTLLSKLTGKFTDTHSEELKRGITIKLGYADMVIYDCEGEITNKEIKGKKCSPIRYVSFVDAPGHEMLMATMLSGAAIIDAAILVISASEGIKPQTEEHLTALQAKKVRNIIIVQNKIDLVSREQAIESYGKIKDFVKGTIAENAPIIPVSTLQEINIHRIVESIAKIPLQKKDAGSEPVFLVARSFDINRPGIKIPEMKGGVLGGILKKGTLKVGDDIEIKPGLSMKKAHKQVYQTLATKIVSLHKGKESLQEVSPGASISIETNLDPYLTKADSLTGCLVSSKGNLPEVTYALRIRPSLFGKVSGTMEHEKIEPIKHREMLMLSVNTTITVGTVDKISKNRDEIELLLNIPVIALKDDNVGIARNIRGHWRLIGWGEVIL
jgi:translation initiation factor 2 subunit 3